MYVYSIYNDITVRDTHQDSPIPNPTFLHGRLFHADMLQDYSVLLYGLPSRSNDELKQQVWVLTNSDNQDTPIYITGELYVKPMKQATSKIPCNKNTIKCWLCHFPFRDFARSYSDRAGKCFYVDSVVYSMVW